MSTSSSARRDTEGSASSRTPSVSRTSADPHRDVIDRLPCFATGRPAAAATKATAVDRLIVPDESPPVPQLSTRGEDAPDEPGGEHQGREARPPGEGDHRRRVELVAGGGDEGRLEAVGSAGEGDQWSRSAGTQGRMRTGRDGRSAAPGSEDI